MLMRVDGSLLLVFYWIKSITPSEILRYHTYFPSATPPQAGKRWTSTIPKLARRSFGGSHPGLKKTLYRQTMKRENLLLLKSAIAN